MKLSEFLVELRKAVNSASNALVERNMEFFNNYFELVEDEEGKKKRIPKTVRMDYPIVTENGDVVLKRMDVPLISLIPINNSKLGKATFSIDFQLEEDKGEIEVHFPKQPRFGEQKHLSHLDISIVPDEIPEGIRTIVDNYNLLIQKQIEG